MQDSTKVATEVDAVLTVLAERFGTTMEHLWGVIVKQVYVSAIQVGIASVLVFILAVVLGVVAKRERENVQKNSARYDPDYFESNLVWVGSGLATAVAVCLALASVGRVINPQFYALQWVLGAVGGN